MKQPQDEDEVPDSSPNKKGKLVDESKGKETMPPPKARKAKFNKLASREITRSVAPGEGTSTKPGDVLRPRASMLGSPSVAEKIWGGVIPLADKEKVDKLSLD